MWRLLAACLLLFLKIDFSFSQSLYTDVHYVYPTTAKNVVPQCINNGNYDFAFKFQTNYPIERDKLAIVIENSNQEVIRRLSLNQLSENSIQEIQKDGHFNYCLFLLYSIIPPSSYGPCFDIIDVDADFYYYYISTDTNKMKVPPQKILVHFQPFDSEPNTYSHCNCN